MTHPTGEADPTTNVAASTTEQAATASVRLCLTFVYPRIVEVIWSDAAAQHLARSQRYPGAVDIEVDWTVEAVNDIDAVQVDPYWTSRVNAFANHRLLGRCRCRPRRARLPRPGRRPAWHDRVAGRRPRVAAVHGWENLMTKRLDPKLARELQDEAARAEAAAEADPEAEFPADASISWPNRSRMLTLRLRQSEYDAIQRAAEQRHLPASTLARSLLLDKLGEQHAS